MTPINRRTAIKLTAAGVGLLALKPVTSLAQESAQLFGTKFPNLESLTTGEWWTKGAAAANENKNTKGKTKGVGGPSPAPSMDVPRDEVVCFACYTQQNGVLKLSAQLFPLKPGEERVARLEVKRDGADWREIAKAEVLYPGWDAHFRVEKWDGSKCWPRFSKVTDGDKAQFPGWPITIAQNANDGRKVHAQLPDVKLDGVPNPVVQVIAEATGEILYTVRAAGDTFTPRVNAPGKYTVKAGKDKPDAVVAKSVEVA
jgi:hypothetical protein